MMKFIKTFGAFSLTFFLSVALIGVPKSISELLIQDVSNGSERDFEIYNIFGEDLSVEDAYNSSAYKQIIDDYANESASIDDSGLPSDFQSAWRDHMAAWREHADFLTQSRNHCKLRKSSGEEFSQTLAQQNAKITYTWLKVLSVARKHDVDIPASYYR